MNNETVLISFSKVFRGGSNVLAEEVVNIKPTKKMYEFGKINCPIINAQSSFSQCDRYRVFIFSIIADDMACNYNFLRYILGPKSTEINAGTFGIK